MQPNVVSISSSLVWKTKVFQNVELHEGVDVMASTAQTEPHFQFTCADPISNGVLCYNVFLCHVDLQTASRDERWPIKTLLYHSSAHKYCVLSASVMCHLRLHACLILQQAMLSE